MLSPEKIYAMKKITEEYKKLNKEPLVQLGITVGLFDEDNMFEWECTVLGPKDSFYKGGLFYLKVIFPENYPISRPIVLFLTPIYHLNIKYFIGGSQPLGYLSLNTLNEWKPGDSIIKILPEIFSLLYKNNPYDAYDDINQSRKNEFINNPTLFKKKAKYFTAKYASPYEKYKNYPNGWDFTYKE